jgi:two-component system, NtrC family, nitrogen regulation sensor histidine kinase GlnL
MIGRVLSLPRRSPPPEAPPDAQAMLAALPVPMVLLNKGNRFRFANHAAEQFLGASLAQLRTLGLADLLPQDNPIFLLIAQVREQGAVVVDHDLTLESPRVNRRGISVHGSPMHEEPGSVLLSFQDASAVRTLGQQISVRGTARSVSSMAAILAHEIKNPLSGIRGAAQLLEGSVAPADSELAVLIRDEADRIRELIDRMEMFGEKPVERRAVNIHRVLEHVRRLAQNGFATTIRMNEVYDPSLPPVWGNRDQLIQVFLNLVKNAAEALVEAEVPAPEIVLSTGFQHGMRIALPGSTTRVELPLLVTVRDNGPGIPDDIRDNIFDPFVTSRNNGSGLGLALVAKIIGDHGGLIEVNSRPGRTEFRIHLPVLQEDSDPDAV